jgi:hypothetical protein
MEKGAAMSYKEMIIPFKMVPFEEMKKKQAEQYYRWYMDTLDERLCRLQKYITETGNMLVLDKTPESLIGLWEWFEPRIELCQKTDLEMEDEVKRFPEKMRYHVLENPNKLSAETVTIAWDIAAYFGEVIIENNAQIHWGYLSTPKKLNGVNQPRLVGFAGDMTVYVYGRVEVCIWKSLNNIDKIRLHDMYIVCKDMM